MKLSITSRARNIVWHKFFGFGHFTRRCTILAGPIRLDLSLL
jgi:hypothetical protein